MLKIHNVKVALGQTNYRKIISQVLNVREKRIGEVKLIKQSVDARREKVHWICSFAFAVDDENDFLKRYPQLSKSLPYHYHCLPKNDKRVVIVGSGPAGLFCAYVLSLVGQKVSVIERGQPIEKRIQDVEDFIHHGHLHEESHIAFGEGGAGTFSDGKLTTGIKNHRLPFILETFVKFGAPEDILYLSKPHIGTDYLRQVIVKMRQFMEAQGVEFLFDTKFVDFQIKGNQKMIKVQHHNQLNVMEADALVLAIGHSARDTYELLYQKGLKLQQKPFAVGVRIEQLQETINRIQYKKSAFSPYLKAASYKLAVQTKDKRGVYTFCMCPGGYVVPSTHEKGCLCINGMSYYARDGKNANSAILVNVKVEDFQSDHVLAGIEFQRELERKAFVMGGSDYGAPVQLVQDYFDNVPSTSLKDVKPTYLPRYILANLNELFPSFINQALKEGLQMMNQKMPGFIDEHTIITGVEARSSAPVRIERNQAFEANIEGIYPIGEGAGYAGGIMSAALDGIMCAEMILKENDNGS